MNTFREVVDNNQDIGMPLIRWQTHYEVQRHNIPASLLFCVLAIETGCNKLMNIFLHIWPYEILAHPCKSLVNAHVPPYGSGMELC